MREFIAALRQLRFPIVLIAVAILVVQTLVAGLATADAAARLATGDAAAGVFCHGEGNGDGGTVPSGKAAHDCCTFCTATGPAALVPGTTILEHLAIVRRAELLAPASGLQRLPRAIRAGPSQAPPIPS